MKTGLIDKNGRWIETGDLIRVFETAISETGTQKGLRGADLVQSEFIGVVAWDEEGQDFELQRHDGECIIGIPRHQQEYEIIGRGVLTPMQRRK